MKNTINCLDHGFVKLLNISGPTRRTDELDENGAVVPVPFDGSDRDPAMTARNSFGNMNADRTKEQDLRLYEYLVRNVHSTPVEMVEIWFVFKMPMFLGEQFLRHRTSHVPDFVDDIDHPTINKISGRYSVLFEEWYIPEVVGGKPTNGVKQGQEDNVLHQYQKWFKYQLDIQCSNSYATYKLALERGIAPEHARLFLHANHYTELVWKQDLHNIMHLLSLRFDEHAQIEARIYSQAIYDLLKQYLPKSMEYFDTYRRQFTKEEKEVIKEAIETFRLTFLLSHEEDKHVILDKAISRLGI